MEVDKLRVIHINYVMLGRGNEKLKQLLAKEDKLTPGTSPGH